MGIQGFTKVFPPKKEIKYTDMRGKNIIIDARPEIYRAALAMSASTGLTDRDGNPTSHINTILLGVILKLKGAGANQYWVFDYDQKRKLGETFHIQMKELELIKRRERKQKSEEKLKELRKHKKALEARAKTSDDQRSDSELFSSSEDEQKDMQELRNLKDVQSGIKDELQCCMLEIDKHEKRAFKLRRFYTDDTIFMLNMLDIPWLMCPPGFEAEQICAMATKTSSIAGVRMDYVLTPDADAVPFGAAAVIKRDIRKKKFFEYNTQELLEEYNLTQDDIIKISLILGCDYAKKTPRIGIKTVLNKYPDVELTDEQKIAESIFKKVITDDEIKTIDINNANRESFTDDAKYVELLDWLQLKKCFDRSRIDKQFKKNGFFAHIGEGLVGDPEASKKKPVKKSAAEPKKRGKSPERQT